MRTTVTFDSDVEQFIRQRMAERGISLNEAVNDAIRSNVLSSEPPHPFRTAIASMGRSLVTLDHALQLTAELEDDDLIRKPRAGS